MDRSLLPPLRQWVAADSGLRIPGSGAKHRRPEVGGHLANGFKGASRFSDSPR